MADVVPPFGPFKFADRVAAVSPCTWAGPDRTDPTNEADIMLLLENGQVWHVYFLPTRGWFSEQIV